MVHASQSGFQSPNWSGLVDTNAEFTAAAGDWVVPQVQPSAAPESSATWVGIDGFDNSTLIQTGTTQETVNNTTDYFAWYEVLPAPPVNLGAVSPGDQISGQVEELAPGIWNVAISDQTSGQSWSTDVSYSGPGASAEWIEEAPALVQNGTVTIETLANFGSATFTNLGTAESGSGVAEPIDMEDSSGNIIAYPTADPTGAPSFTITYGSPTTTPPPPTTTTSPPVTTTSPPTTTVPTPTAPGGITPVNPVCDQALNTGVVGMATSSDGGGYWIADRTGRVATCGDAPNLGQLNFQPTSPVVAIAATPDHQGFWLATATGQVFPFGDAVDHGSINFPLNKPVISMVGDPATGGYWLLGGDGGVFSFGAPFYGSTGSIHLNAPAVTMVATSDGGGYFFVASDGGIFNFGNSIFHGSMGGQHLNKPVVGAALDPATGGYWLDASDGGIFSFDAPFLGSHGGSPLNRPCVAMTATPDGGGYRFVASDGGIFDYGDAAFEGSAVA